jgi:hypothetical protein
MGQIMKICPMSIMTVMSKITDIKKFSDNFWHLEGGSMGQIMKICPMSKITPMLKITDMSKGPICPNDQY